MRKRAKNINVNFTFKFFIENEKSVLNVLNKIIKRRKRPDLNVKTMFGNIWRPLKNFKIKKYKTILPVRICQFASFNL